MPQPVMLLWALAALASNAAGQVLSGVYCGMKDVSLTMPIIDVTVTRSYRLAVRIDKDAGIFDFRLHAPGLGAPQAATCGAFPPLRCRTCSHPLVIV